MGCLKTVLSPAYIYEKLTAWIMVYDYKDENIDDDYYFNNNRAPLQRGYNAKIFLYTSMFVLTILALFLFIFLSTNWWKMF